MKNLLFLITLFIYTSGASQITDSIYTYSASMDKKIMSIVIHNDMKSPNPTIFILHGWSGNPKRTILEDIPTLKKISHKHSVNFVIPDGSYDSWYIDSPSIKSYYETFLTQELFNVINNNYLIDQNKVAILGWSMGGHGALYLGARHPNIYSAVGAISAAIDFRKYGMQYGVDKVLNNQLNWYNYTALSQINKFINSNQFLTISCGYQDEFLHQNRVFHNLLINLNVPHTYTESNGNHSAKYWANAAHNQILDIIRHFKSK